MMRFDSVSHANSYIAYKTQENSMKALASRSASSATPIRQRTLERVAAGIQEAIQEMREDLCVILCRVFSSRRIMALILS